MYPDYNPLPYGDFGETYPATPPYQSADPTLQAFGPWTLVQKDWANQDRLPEESGCLVPTVVLLPQRYGDVTTRGNQFATHADFTTNYTG